MISVENLPSWYMRFVFKQPKWDSVPSWSSTFSLSRIQRRLDFWRTEQERLLKGMCSPRSCGGLARAIAGSTGCAAPGMCFFTYKQLFFSSKKVNFSHVWNEAERSWSQQSIGIVPSQLSPPASGFGLKVKQPRNDIYPFCRWHGCTFVPGKRGNCLSWLFSWIPTVLWLLSLETGQDRSRKFKQLSCKNHEELQAKLHGLHWVEFDHCLLYWHFGRGFVV